MLDLEHCRQQSHSQQRADPREPSLPPRGGGDELAFRPAQDHMDQQPRRECLKRIHALAVQAGKGARTPRETQAGGEHDGHQGAGRFPGAVCGPQEPPDEESHGESVQDDGQREEIPVGARARGACAEGGPVRRRVHTESQQAQEQGRRVSAIPPLGKEPVGQAGSERTCQSEEDNLPLSSGKDREQDTQDQHTRHGHENESVQEDLHPPVGLRQMVDERPQEETQQAGQQQLKFAGAKFS